MAGPTTDQRPEKETGREKVAGRSGVWRRGVPVLLMAVFYAAIAGAVEDVAQLQQRFDRETDGVRKAKLLQKLGDAQFEAERNAARSNDYATVGLVMEKYRDNVRAALETLKKTHPDGEKHSSGYRQLEMHTGRGIREIRDVLLIIPEQFRPPMRLVEQDLLDLDNEMLKLLFPRRPGEKPPLQQRPSSATNPQAAPEKNP